jgi:hypothetical protein
MRGRPVSARRAVLGCALLVAAACPLYGCGAARSQRGSGAVAIQPPGGSAGFSPYVDVTLSPPFDLAGVATSAGARGLTLAFVTAAGACRPSWGGSLAISAPAVADPANRLRAAGVALRVSFGGAAGPELAKGCTSVARLAAAYASVLDRYRAVAADFDLEGATLEDRPAMVRRALALARMQSLIGRPLSVSLTLPASRRGLTESGLAALRAMLESGVRVHNVNLLAMDYGSSVAPGAMGAAAIAAALSAHVQLMRLGGALSSWRALGVTVMIGVNDTAGEVFTLGDARQVEHFAARQGLGAVSLWSLARDNPCAGGASVADPTCSGVGAPPYAFSRALGARPRPGVLPRRAPAD